MKKEAFAVRTIWLLLAGLLLSVVYTSIHTMSIPGGKENEKIVVIDAGHGGDDPGKVGINGALEKDINLRVAKLVTRALEQNDIQVVLTRSEDQGLYQSDSKNRKIEDLKNRMALIESSGASLAVSIHQNSYTLENVRGAQVFFYETSRQGKRAATIMQKELKNGMDAQNKRQEKPNKSYYLLKRSSIPTIIVECGFLSNGKDAALLVDEAYQKKLAFYIAMGILKYLNGDEAPLTCE